MHHLECKIPKFSGATAPSPDPIPSWPSAGRPLYGSAPSNRNFWICACPLAQKFPCVVWANSLETDGITQCTHSSKILEFKDFLTTFKHLFKDFFDDFQEAFYDTTYILKDTPVHCWANLPNRYSALC